MDTTADPLPPTADTVDTATTTATTTTVSSSSSSNGDPNNSGNGNSNDMDQNADNPHEPDTTANPEENNQNKQQQPHESNNSDNNTSSDGVGEKDLQQEEKQEENQDKEKEEQKQALSRTSSRPAPRMIEFPLTKVNPYIICKLCAGYFISATTITECLHTFCKSCIVTYFENNKHCPTCGVLVHEANPIETLRQDRTMQSIVYKLVEGLEEEEMERQRVFLAAQQGEEDNKSGDQDHQANNPHSSTTSEHTDKPNKETKTSPKKNSVEGDEIYFLLELEDKSQIDSPDDNITTLQKPFIRTSGRATIQHLKKFLAKKLSLVSPDDVDILCCGEVLGREYTLEYVSKTRWRKKKQLILRYRPKVDFQV